MSRLQDLLTFIEFDSEKHAIIEPEKRRENIEERVKDVLKTYNPGVVVKAGLGSGHLVREMVKSCSSYIVVVEPSFKVIDEFRKGCDEEMLDRIRFINGEFNTFPVDYYSADLLISIDNFNIIESSRVVDEFYRATEFEGILFIALAVLHDEDLDGLYDDYMKTLMPIHNDYYLENDLKTFLELNKFDFIKGNCEFFKEDITEKRDYVAGLYKETGAKAADFLQEHEEDFKKLYKFDGVSIEEPYYIGVFMKRKAERIKY